MASNTVSNIVALVSANIKPFTTGMQRVQRTLSTSGSDFKRFAKIAAASFAAITATVSAFAISAVKAAMDLENLSVSFEIMLGSAREADRVIKSLLSFTARTPFQLEGVAAAGRQLLAAGVATEKLEKELKVLGDLASVTNVPLTDMAQIYSKAMNKGKLQAEELNQLAERGIPIIQTLAELYGVTKQEIFDMGSKGLIAFEDMQAAFERMTSSGGIAFNAMQKQSQTLSGIISTMKDEQQQVMAKIGNQLMPLVAMATWKWNRALQSVSNILDQIGFKSERATKGNAITDLFGGMIASPSAPKIKPRKAPSSAPSGPGLNTGAQTMGGQRAISALSNEVEKLKIKFVNLGNEIQQAVEFKGENGIVRLAKTIKEKFGTAIQFAADSMGRLSNIINMMHQNELNDLTAKENAERARWEAAYSGTAEYSERMDELSKKQDERRKKMQREQAERQKAIMTFQALMAGAMAVLSTLADPTLPFGVKIAASAIIGGLAGAEIAAIHGATIPSFAMGGMMPYGGVARVGELGPENVYLPAGAQVIPNRLSGGGGLQAILDREQFVIWKNEGNLHHSFRNAGIR